MANRITLGIDTSAGSQGPVTESDTLLDIATLARSSSGAVSLYEDTFTTTITIGGGTNQTTVTIGKSGQTTNVLGVLDVDGTSVFGGAADFDAGITVASAQSITGDAALTITSGGSSDLSLDSASGTIATNATALTADAAFTISSGATDDNLTLATGNNGAGASGDISIDVGTASTTAGTISIGTANAVSVTLGASGIDVLSPGAGTNSVKLGVGAAAAGDYGIAIGNNASASTQYAVALGLNAVASGATTTALGWATDATAQYGTAVGAAAQATLFATTAVGYAATCSGYQSVAVGRSSNAGQDSTIIGDASSGSGYTSVVAVGRSITSVGTATVAIGAGASGSASSVAVGYSAAATGTNNSIAIGYDSTASHAISVAIGRSAVTSASFQFAVGSNAYKINEFRLGWGGVSSISSATANPVTISPSPISTTRTDYEGHTLYLTSGEGTGDGTESWIELKTPNKVGTGTTQQTLTTRLKVATDAITVAVPINAADNTGVVVGKVGTGSGTGSALQAASFTTTERGYLTSPANGMIVYDETLNQLMGYINSSWTNLTGSGLSPVGTYTVTNDSTDRTYDANSTTIDELADVLGTLIADLQTQGIIG